MVQSCKYKLVTQDDIKINKSKKTENQEFKTVHRDSVSCKRQTMNYNYTIITISIVCYLIIALQYPIPLAFILKFALQQNSSES